MTAAQQIPSRETLILFARPPLPGRAKTRLIPLFGESGAADLYRAFLAAAAALAASVRAARPTVGLTAEWAMDGEAPEDLPTWLPGPFPHRAQTGSYLGARMAAALGRRLAHDNRASGGRAVLIGTDFPDLPPEIPIKAFEALERMARDSAFRDSSPNTPAAVLGPSSDGGYYLIGLSRPVPEIFTGIEWGSNRVFETTLQKLNALAFQIHVLPEWHDVDEPDDLAALRARLEGQPGSAAAHTRGVMDRLRILGGSDL